MRVLLTGAGGLVGRACQRAFAADDVWAATHTELDVTDRVAVESAVAGFRPDAVVNAAAVAHVDACDAEPDRAFTLNAVAPGLLALAAARAGAVMCHLSTDYVFGGVAGGVAGPPYDEWSPVAPVQTYGRTKAGGEAAVRMATTAHVIARTSWVFAADGGMAARILDQYERDGEVRAFGDQWNAATCGDELAATLRRLLLSGRFGTFHVCGEGRTTRAGLSRAVLEANGIDPSAVVEVPMASVPGLSPRPTDTTMEPRALRLAGIVGPGPWRDAL